MINNKKLIEVMTKLGLLHVKPWTCTKDHVEKWNHTPICNICYRIAPTSSLEIHKFLIPTGLVIFPILFGGIAIGITRSSIQQCPFRLEGSKCFLNVGIISFSQKNVDASNKSRNDNSSPLMKPIQCPNQNSQSSVGSLVSPQAFSLSRNLITENKSPDQLSSNPTQLPRFIRPDYPKFKKFLEDQLKYNYNQVIKIEFDDSISFNSQGWMEKATQKIQQKKWDVAFLPSPLLAVKAQENQYEFAAKLFEQDELQSVLFTRTDASIKIPKKDITSKTTIALLGKEDMLGFYLPIYQLYGLSFQKKEAVSLRHVLEMVTCGDADIGVGIQGIIKQNSKLRIISDRAFPSGSVYLSPQITEEQKKWFQKLFRSAPTEIQQSAGISTKNASKEPNYNDVKLKKMTVEAILKCSNLDINPVKLYRCHSQEISGVVKGINLDHSIVLRTTDGSEYQVIIPDEISQRVKITSGTSIKLTVIKPIFSQNGVKQIKIENLDQIQIKN